MNASQRNLFTYIYLSKLVHLYLIRVFDQFWNIVNLNKTKQNKKNEDMSSSKASYQPDQSSR